MLRGTVPFMDRDTILSPDGFERLFLGEENAAKSHLRKVQTSVPIDRIIIEISKVIGNSAKMIVDFTEKHNVDLISTSDHRYWLPGSVGERVMRDAPCARSVNRRQKVVQEEGLVWMGMCRDV